MYLIYEYKIINNELKWWVKLGVRWGGGGKKEIHILNRET